MSEAIAGLDELQDSRGLTLMGEIEIGDCPQILADRITRANNRRTFGAPARVRHLGYSWYEVYQQHQRFDVRLFKINGVGLMHLTTSDNVGPPSWFGG